VRLARGCLFFQPGAGRWTLPERIQVSGGRLGGSDAIKRRPDVTDDLDVDAALVHVLQASGTEFHCPVGVERSIACWPLRSMRPESTKR
jgi:hypothetical protein